MKVLIACECSGVVRDAFRARGHDAWSCDLLPDVNGRNEFHFQRYVQDIIGQGEWDLMIAHPPCTRLANSGVLRLYNLGKKINGSDPLKWTEMRAGAVFFKTLWNAPVERICVENPVMHGHARAAIGELPKSQRIQPFQFGHPESKATMLWLKNLPPLVPTNILTKPECGYWENQTPTGQNKLGPSPTRAAKRAVTYKGIAEAMAKQWSDL